MNCGDLLSPLIESIIFEKDDAKTLIKNYFEVENLNELNDLRMQEFLTEATNHPFLKGKVQRVQKLLKALENIILLEAPIEVSSKGASENIDIEEQEPEKVYVHKDYTFISQSEAKSKLFKNNDHLLVKYESYIQKFLLGNLFLNLDLPTLITTDEQMKVALCEIVNHWSNKLIGKPIFAFFQTTITPLYNNYYHLNYEINEILKDPQNLQHLNDLKFGESTKDLLKVVAAITLANFKTVLSDYLPGILSVDSNVPGLDLENINNKNIYTINTASFLTDWTDQEKIVDRNSNLAKMILNFFDNIIIYERNGDISIRLLKEPIFSLANFYYISSILSNYINSNNYINEFNQLLTALMLLRMRGINHTTRLQDLEQTNREVIGKFDTDYLTKVHPELNKLLDERVLFNLIGTLYYNMLRTENDPIFSTRTFSINESTWKNLFSLAKYYTKYSKQQNFGKQNLHSLIYQTFNGYSQRNYHDIAYDPSKGRIVSTPLTLSVVNRELFNMQKVHQNLISFNDTIKNRYISNIDSKGITFLLNGHDVKVSIIDGRWQKVEDDALRNKIEKLFKQLTFVDVTDPLLLDSANYSMSNLLDVIYAMINLHDRREDNKDLLSSKKRLEKAWNPFARKDSSGKPLNINSILYGMGAQYGLLNGVLSRMTLLNKEGAQLPTFGNVGLMYRYNSYLESLRLHQNLAELNIFVINPELFVNVSSKNQVIIDGEITDFKSADERDQIIVNLFYEYLQRRNSPTKLGNYLVEEEINYDGTIHFQPLVYADKTQQNVIGINSNTSIKYYDLDGLIIAINSYDLNGFTEKAIPELKKALYLSLGHQHLVRYNRSLKAFNNILVGLGLETAPTLESSFQYIQDFIKNTKETTGVELDLVDLWLQYADEPLIQNLYFEGENGNYRLNNTLLFYYKLFNFENDGTINHYERFHNLGILEFLYKFSQMNIDLTSTNFKVFKNQTNYLPIINDINNVLDSKVQNELEKFLLFLRNFIVNPNNNQSLDEKLLWEQEHLNSNGSKHLIFSSDKEISLFHKQLEQFLTKNSKILQQFYWESELFGQNYELSANGPIYLHALKGSKETLYLELVSRLAMSQKRNVTHQATVNPYSKNDITGHAAVRNVVFIKEPIRVIDNPIGNKEDLESHNGGEIILLLQRILENNSMLGTSNPLHHKSFIFGKTYYKNKFVESILFKYASYALINERIRSSEKYQNLIKYALNQKIEFLDKLDFTKDFNGNVINYSDFNIIEETETGWRRLLSAENLGHNVLKFTYVDNVNDFETETVEIKTLYDLYKQLGEHRTVTLKGDTIFENNNNSWEAFLKLCNLVGFTLKNESEQVLQAYAELSGNSVLEIRALLKSTVDTQLNVAQPLKFAFISQFTPNTAVKFGGLVGEEINYFNDEISEQSLHPVKVYDVILGVQLDSSHEGEESTEPTQMINGVALDNMSPELIDLYRYKALYILEVMGKTYPDIKFRSIEELNNNDDYLLDHCKQLAFIYNKLQSQVLNSSYDNGQTASLILISVLNFVKDFEKLNERNNLSKREKADLARVLLRESFNVSLSHPSVNKIFITALAALNSKIGVRLSGAGLRDVLAPHEGYMRFVEVPTLEKRLHDKSGQEKYEDFYEGNRNFKQLGKYVFNYTNYTTLTVDEFSEHISKNPEYQVLLDPAYRYTLVYDNTVGVGEFNLSLYRHYVVENLDGTRMLIYVSDYEILKDIKSKLWANQIRRIDLDNLSGYDWVVEIDGITQRHPQRGRHLKPIDFEFVLENLLNQKRVYSIYDCTATEILFLLDKDIILAKEKLKEILNSLDLIKFKITPEEIDSMSDKQFLNYVRSILSYEYYLLKTGKRLLNEEDFNFQNLPKVSFSNDELITIKSDRFFDAEMIAAHPQNYKFGITNRMQILDVTLDSITEELNKQLGEVDNINIREEDGKKYIIPLYFMLENGNVYVVENIPHLQNIYPIDDKFLFNNEFGEQFVQFEIGRPLLKVGEGIAKDHLFITYLNGIPKLVIKHKKHQDPLLKKSSLETLLEISENISETNKRNPIFVKNTELLEEEKEYLNGIDRLDMLVEDLDERDEKYYKSINHLAKSKYSLFQLMLRHATSRIPGQSYQSFSATRITRFLHGEPSTCLINDHNIWITGGDYDIDKLFSIGYNLTRQGRFIGWNPFFNDSTFEHLMESLKLPAGNNEIIYSDDLNLVDLELESTIPGITNQRLLNLILYKHKGKIKQYTNIRYPLFKAFVKLYNDIVTHGLKTDNQDFLLEYIDALEAKDWTNKNVTEALQNRVVRSTRMNFSDIRNTIPSYSPISLGLVKALKNSSFQEQQAKINHPFNPIKQVNDIYNQYAGKSVVGIMASGLKLYATISYTVEKNLYQQKSAKELKNMLFSQKVYTNVDDNGNVKFKVTNGFAGIRYDLTPESLQILQLLLLELGSEKTLLEIEEQFKEDYKSDSVLLAISELLTAATDNGKEMILGIINSGKETLGIYTYALMLGYSLEEIGDIMISEPVSFIIKNLKRSLFLKEPFKNLIDVSSWFVSSPPLESFIPITAVYNVLSTLGILNQEDLLKKSLSEIARLAELKKQVLKFTPVKYIAEEEFFYDTKEPETFDAYTSLQNWLKTKQEIEAIKANPQSLVKAKIFATLVENAQTFTTTVQLLSTNQEVHSNLYDLIRLSVSFEDHIRNYLLEVPDPKSTKSKPLPNIYIDYHNNGFKVDSLDEGELKLLKEFSLWQFFTNAEYAEKMIRIFNKFKADLNPLLIIYHLEHFKEMIKVSLITEQLYKKYSVTYRTLYNFIHSENNETLNLLSILEGKKRTAIISLNSLQIKGLEQFHGILNSTIKKIVKERYLDKTLFGVLEDIINDTYIHNSLVILQDLLGENYLRIKVEKDGSHFVKIVNLGMLNGDDNVLGRKEFINYVETKLIPAWKTGLLSLESTEENPILSDNEFINALHIRDFKVPTREGERYTAFGVLNYRSTNNQQSKIDQNMLNNALYQLEGLTVDGVSIVDILFLYNMIVHRGKNGEFTMSSFFDPSKHAVSIVNKYYELTNRINMEIENLPLGKLLLLSNGFNRDLNYSINLKPEPFIESLFKSIYIWNDSLGLEKLKTLNLSLEQKLNALSEIKNNIKFICI